MLGGQQWKAVVVAPPSVVVWLTWHTTYWQRQWPMCNSHLGTIEPCHADIYAWWHQVYTLAYFQILFAAHLLLTYWKSVIRYLTGIQLAEHGFSVSVECRKNIYGWDNNTGSEACQGNHSVAWQLQWCSSYTPIDQCSTSATFKLFELSGQWKAESCQRSRTEDDSWKNCRSRRR